MGLPGVRERIEAACKACGRNPSSVELVAVSKSQPLEKIRPILNEGQRVFGENRVQEAKEKYPALREEFPDISLHFIGHLQSNKVRDAVRIFDVIETVDSKELAQELRHEMEKQKRFLPCFIQVNTGEEPQKGGISLKDLAQLVAFCRHIGLQIVGLMCVPPLQDIPDLHFALLHKLSRLHGLEKLSMGMSVDFETAIRYGATHVRIGSALFGPRKSN
jgi:PLP dependent protein